VCEKSGDPPSGGALIFCKLAVHDLRDLVILKACLVEAEGDEVATLSREMFWRLFGRRVLREEVLPLLVQSSERVSSILVPSANERERSVTAQTESVGSELFRGRSKFFADAELDLPEGCEMAMVLLVESPPLLESSHEVSISGKVNGDAQSVGQVQVRADRQSALVVRA